MNPDDAYKNKIGERIVRGIAQGLKENKITVEEASVISTYLLENIDKAKDNLRLFNFLEELAKKWPIFSNILTVETGEIKEEKEKEAVKKASNLIQQDKIEEAIKVAEDATTQKTGGTV
jgi:hypothetical protein